MSTIQLSELGALAEQVKRGETVDILDGEKAVAKVVPVETRDMTDEEWLDELERQGKVTRGRGKLPEWFFTDPLPESAEGSALEQLLKDRRKNDW
ncbi:MAG TPA: hypothetical protein VGF48_03725 [Thermoanaerobaculia bacterium]|jgi:antitoxin (DNA-binding transcriptional repressor) of toxin-antitoxin stability system